jgi:transposase
MSARPKRSFDREFKLQVVRQLVSGEKRLAQICREYDLCQTLVRHWRSLYERDGENAWSAGRETHIARDPELRIAELEAALGRAHLEIDLLRRAVEKGGSRRGSDGR